MDNNHTQKALLIIHPSKGHINAVRNLVKILKEKYLLAVCGAAIGKIEMEVFNSTVFGLNSMPAGQGFEYFLCQNDGKYDYLCELKMRKSMSLFKSRAPVLTSILEHWKPDIIFIDILYNTDLLVIRNWLEGKSIKVFLIRIKPCLMRRKYTIPSVYNAIFKNNFQSNVLWGIFNLKKAMKANFDYIRFQGYDNVSMLHKIRKLLPFSSELMIRSKNVVGVNIGKYPQLVLLPKEFEFGNYLPSPDEHYLGFQYNSPIPSGIDVSFNDVIQKVVRLRSEGQKIITISFGSLYEKFFNEINTILDKLDRCLPLLSCDVHVIVVGKFNDHKMVIKNVDSSRLVEAPLKDLLQYSDLHICHGGINTIKDCLFSYTQMLIFPLNKNWDQPGNAAKVEYHGLGIASFTKVKIKTLYSQLAFLLNNFNKSAFDKFIKLEKDVYGDGRIKEMLNFYNYGAEI